MVEVATEAEVGVAIVLQVVQLVAMELVLRVEVVVAVETLASSAARMDTGQAHVLRMVA